MYSHPVFFQDFGDGGAFPEIHVAQFPLEMGRKKKTSNALAVQVDAEGKIKYDAIAKQGQGKDKVCRVPQKPYTLQFQFPVWYTSITEHNNGHLLRCVNLFSVFCCCRWCSVSTQTFYQKKF